MNMVDGYTESYLIGKEDATMTGATIVGDDLVFIRKDGTTKNVGAIRGDKGVDGEDGTLTQVDLDNGQAGLLYTNWAALPLAANWGAMPSGNWCPAQYRYNSYHIELRGMVLYSGTTQTSGYHYVATALPVGPIERHIFLGSLHSRDIGDFRMLEDGRILVYVASHLSSLAANDWVSFNNVRIPLD